MTFQKDQKEQITIFTYTAYRPVLENVIDGDMFLLLTESQLKQLV